MSVSGRPKIVILGAGFAGINAAQELAHLLPHAADAQITLVDQNNYFLFTPMLTEVAGGEIDTRHSSVAIRRFDHRIQFKQGQVEQIDLKNKRINVTLSRPGDSIPQAQESIEADHLVIALGSDVNYYGISGLEENSLTIKSLGDAAAIRNRVLGLLERADEEPDPDTRQELLTVVVGGGGFSGVETMAAVNDLLREGCKHYPRIAPNDIRTIILHADERLLPELEEDLAAFAQKKLEQRGVEVYLNTFLSGAGKDYVETRNGKRFKTHLLIWTGGVAVPQIIKDLDCQHSKVGAIITDEHCVVKDHPGVWAVGDSASVPQPGKDKPYSPTAQNSQRGGKLVAQNIVATLRGEPLKPFIYHPIGELAMVGKHNGVASVYGLHFSGPIAWMMWRAIYLFKMPHRLMRLRVGMDWLLDLFFGREISELPAIRPGELAGQSSTGQQQKPREEPQKREEVTA